MRCINCSLARHYPRKDYSQKVDYAKHFKITESPTILVLDHEKQVFRTSRPDELRQFAAAANAGK